MRRVENSHPDIPNPNDAKLDKLFAAARRQEAGLLSDEAIAAAIEPKPWSPFPQTWTPFTKIAMTTITASAALVTALLLFSNEPATKPTAMAPQRLAESAPTQILPTARPAIPDSVRPQKRYIRQEVVTEAPLQEKKLPKFSDANPVDIQAACMVDLSAEELSQIGVRVTAEGTVSWLRKNRQNEVIRESFPKEEGITVVVVDSTTVIGPRTTPAIVTNLVGWRRMVRLKEFHFLRFNPSSDSDKLATLFAFSLDKDMDSTLQLAFGAESKRVILPKTPPRVGRESDSGFVHRKNAIVSIDIERTLPEPGVDTSIRQLHVKRVQIHGGVNEGTPDADELLKRLDSLRANQKSLEESVDLSRFIPIRIFTSKDQSTATILWYEATPAFVNLLPEFYQKEFAPLVDKGGSDKAAVEPLSYCSIPTTGGALSDLTISPNPSSSMTRLTYKQSEPRAVSVALHDLLGHVVKELTTTDRQPSGEYTITLNLTGVKEGMYLAVLRSDQGEQIMQRIIVQLPPTVSNRIWSSDQSKRRLLRSPQNISNLVDEQNALQLKVNRDTLTYCVRVKLKEHTLLGSLALMLAGKAPWRDSVTYRVIVTRSGVSNTETDDDQSCVTSGPLLTSTYVNGRLRAQTWNENSSLLLKLREAIKSKPTTLDVKQVSEEIGLLTPITVDLGEGQSAYQVVLWYETDPWPLVKNRTVTRDEDPTLSVAVPTTQSVASTAKLKARIAPNPTSAVSNLVARLDIGSAEVSVVSATGVLLFDTEFEVKHDGESSIALDGNLFPSGIYTVVITTTSGKHEVLRWVVIK